jgi:MoxR-like ATPase
MPLQDQLRADLFQVGYIADEGLATTLWLAENLQRPVLLEGSAGVGKTAVACAYAKARGRRLVRLQCYEGLDLQQAAYEWNYSRQLLAIRQAEVAGGSPSVPEIFSAEYLLERPLLAVLTSAEPCVLLVDEIDRADEAFEAFLLEVLGEGQMSVPELGTITARHPLFAVLTSNATRELSDALRRRCLFHYLDFPDLAREMQIVRTCVPEADARLVEQVVQLVHRLRREDLNKTPGIAETLDWVRALHRFDLSSLPDDPRMLEASLGCVLKTQGDRFQFGGGRLAALMAGC